jgi:hypothetical protein
MLFLKTLLYEPGDLLFILNDKDTHGSETLSEAGEASVAGSACQMQ